MRNTIYPGIEDNQRPETVGNDVAPGTPLIIGGRPVVTITGSGDYNSSNLTSTGNAEADIMLGISTARGGVGLADDQATVAPDGTFAFNVEGATASTATNGVPVYITSAGALTLTEAGNTKYGKVEFFRGQTPTDTAVTIGVNLG